MMSAKYHVLIVEDQRDARQMLRAGVESLGKAFRVTEVPSAEEALFLATNKPVDLLVADVRLPGMSGLELVQRVRQKHPAMKLILITGLQEPHIRRQVAEAGAEAFFFKPVELADFLDAVERSLGVVETLLPPAPIDVDEPPQAEVPEPLPEPPPATQSQDLVGQLTQLCQQMAAQTAIIVGAGGRVVARSGELLAVEDEIDLAAQAAQWCATRASLGNASLTFAVFAGEHSLLALAALDPAANLLVIGAAGALADFCARAASHVVPALPLLRLALDARAGLAGEQASAAQEAALIAAAEIDTGELAQLDDVFSKAPSLLASSRAVDAFWDSPGEGSAPDILAGGKAISFDQALRLGLTPKNSTRTAP